MSNIQQKAQRIGELERVRTNLLTYSHADDVAATIALSLRYLGGTVHREAVLGMLVDGIDEMLARAKMDLREDLK